MPGGDDGAARRALIRPRIGQSAVTMRAMLGAPYAARYGVAVVIECRQKFGHRVVPYLARAMRAGLAAYF